MACVRCVLYFSRIITEYVMIFLFQFPSLFSLCLYLFFRTIHNNELPIKMIMHSLYQINTSNTIVSLLY